MSYRKLPALPPYYVPRPRLDQLWDRLIDRRLILVTAGAGFGKTSFLSAQAARSARPSVWCSLEDVDSDPSSLLAKLCAAIRASSPRSAKDRPGAERFDPSRVTLTDLMKSLRDGQGGLVLFLDDVHFVSTSPEALLLLDRLVSALPEASSVVLASREPVGLQTARLRSLGAVGKIDGRDLQFTGEEIEALLRRRFPGIHPEPLLMRRLLEETEGWAAGIEILLQAAGGAQWAMLETLDRSGAHGSCWFDYFAEEVIGRLDAPTRKFLVRSAVLPRMEPGICDRVLETDGSLEILEGLCARSLFTFPIDAERKLFRYHHLFRDFLLERLEREEGREAVRGLRLRSAEALVDAGAWAEAAMAYAEGGDPKATLDLLCRLGESLLAAGKYRVLRRALESVPAELLDRNPAALALLGRLQEIHGEWEDARRIYAKALSQVPRGPQRAGLLELLARTHIRRGEYGAGERACLEALSQPGRKAARLRGRILCLLGVTAGELGRLTESEKRFLEAIRIFRRIEDAREEARAIDLMAANVCYFRGDYCRAKDLGRDALVIFQRLGDQRWICHTLMGIGQHAAAAGEEREARDLSERALRLAENLEYRMAEGYCRNTLGLCALLAHSPEAARQHFEQARCLGEQLGELSLLTWPRLGNAEAHLMEGNRRGAKIIATEILAQTRRGRAPYAEGRCYTILGKSEAGTQVAAAARWWRKAEGIFRRIGAFRGLHEVLLLRCAAGDVPGRSERKVLSDLLAGVATFDHRFLLIELEPERAAVVLIRAVELGVETDYAAGLLVAMGEGAVPRLEQALDRIDGPARTRIVEVLAQIGGSRAHRILKREGRVESPSGQIARIAAADLETGPIASLKVRALGPCVVSVADEPIPPDAWKSARAMRLLQFLLLQRSRWVPREVIAEGLWPEADPQKAENNLRQTVHLLRRTIEPSLTESRLSRHLRFRNEAYRLDLGEEGEFDLETFERLTREGERLLDEGRRSKAEAAFRSAVDLYRGDLFEESPYEEFIAASREDAKDRHMLALTKLIEICAADRRLEESIPLCRHALLRDPYSEEIAWHLIHALLQLGNRREALDAYHRYEAKLIQDLDLLPSARMRILAQQAAALRPRLDPSRGGASA